MRVRPRWVTPEKDERVEEVREVVLHGDVVHPGFYSVCEPDNGRLEYGRGRKKEQTDHSGYIVDLKMSELDVISRLNRLDHPFPSTCKKSMCE